MTIFNNNKTLRYLRKNAAFTAINVGGLAFGIACAILIILHVYKENSYNSAIPENNTVFNLLQKTPESPLGNTSISYALTPMLAEQFPEIEYYARTENYSWFNNCIVSNQHTDPSQVIRLNEPDFYLADKDLFRIIQYPFVEGKPENALETPNSIVLSKETAEKYFGGRPALGKTLILNNDITFNVAGVVDIPEYVTFHFSMLAPITTLRSESSLKGWNSNGEPFFKLNKNVDYKEFNRQIEHFYSEYKPIDIPNLDQVRLNLLPISERHLYYNKRPLHLLIFIGIVVLIVSILNYVNMSTSLVQKRKQQVALKKISGAGKKEIGKEFLMETSWIVFFAIILGTLLAYIGISLFRILTGSNIEPYFHSNIKLLFIGSGVLWLVISLLSGFYPAIVLSGIKSLTLFKKGGQSRFGIKSKNVLITFQFIISLILIIITLMVNRQYRYMEEMPLGLNNEMVIQIPFTDKLKNNYLNLKDELKKIPQVKNLCAASSMPVGIPNHSGVSWIDEKGEKHEDSFGFAITSEDYTQTFEMQMASGNEFVVERREELNGVIINETAAKRMANKNPVGQQLYFWGKQNTIIGVVKDFQNNYLFNAVKPMVISAHPDNQHFTKYLFVSLSPGDVSGTIKSIEKIIKTISPEFPFEYRFTNAEVAGYINEIKQINSSFRFASIVSILLAVIGLIALTYHSTQSRIKEIGIRKVNGARNLEIINLLNSSFLRSIIIAYVISCPIAWMIIFNLLQGIANKASIAWWIFALAGTIALVIALVTVSFQSYKAANKNPVEALRYE